MHGFGWGRRFAIEFASKIAKDEKPMQRAGHKRPGMVRATPQSPSSAKNGVTVAIRLLEDSLPTLAKAEKAAEIDDAVAGNRGAQQQSLELAIRQRIEQRLNGRVRNLSVRAHGDVVILEGECSTFYTKQLAQHAAMGVLEEEHLENAIVVSVPK
jgi:osmotically-inducible protein OsmY